MRVLLAGATGVIGRPTVPLLPAAGHEVTTLARRPANLPGVEWLTADAGWKPRYASCPDGFTDELDGR